MVVLPCLLRLLVGHLSIGSCEKERFGAERGG